jgi:hypothetical protein
LASLFLISGYGLLLKSTEVYGWLVYYGPVIGSLELVQTFLVLAAFGVFYFLKPSLFLFVVPLLFGLDPLVRSLRYTQLQGTHYLGIAWDDLRLIGIQFQSPLGISFFNRDFANEIAASFLKFNFEDIWHSPFLSIVVYPIVHIVLAFPVYKLLKKFSPRVRKLAIGLLVLLFALHLSWVWGSSPRVVIPAV